MVYNVKYLLKKKKEKQRTGVSYKRVENTVAN